MPRTRPSGLPRKDKLAEDARTGSSGRDHEAFEEQKRVLHPPPPAAAECRRILSAATDAASPTGPISPL